MYFGIMAETVALKRRFAAKDQRRGAGLRRGGFISGDTNSQRMRQARQIEDVVLSRREEELANRDCGWSCVRLLLLKSVYNDFVASQYMFVCFAN